MYAYKVPLIIVTPTGTSYVGASISSCVSATTVREWHPSQVKPHKTTQDPSVSNDTNMHPQQVLAGCAQHTPPAKPTCSPPAKSPSHQLLIWWMSTHAKTIISRGNPTHTHAKHINHSNMVYIRSSRNKGTQLAMQVHLITVIKR